MTFRHGVGIVRAKRWVREVCCETGGSRYVVAAIFKAALVRLVRSILDGLGGQPFLPKVGVRLLRSQGEFAV